MRHILSFGISILSIIVGIIIILKYYIASPKEGLIGAAWTLLTLGAPTTFLNWFIYKLGFSKNFISSLIWICFFYLLQYQLIALLIYKGIIDVTTRKGISYLIAILIIIIISANIMWRIIMGR